MRKNMKNNKYSITETELLYSIRRSIENLIIRIQYDYYLCNEIDLTETMCVSQQISETTLAKKYNCEYNICVNKCVYKLTVQLNTFNDTYLIELKCSNNTLLHTIVIAQNYDLVLNNIVFNLIKYNETIFI